MRTDLFQVIEGGRNESAVMERPRRRHPEVAALRLLGVMRARVQGEGDVATDMELDVLERFAGRAGRERAEARELVAAARGEAVELSILLGGHSTGSPSTGSGFGKGRGGAAFERARVFAALENLNRALGGLAERLSLVLLLLVIQVAAFVAVSSGSGFEMRRAPVRAVRVVRRNERFSDGGAA